MIWGDQWKCTCGCSNPWLRSRCRECATPRSWPADAEVQPAAEVMQQVFDRSSARGEPGSDGSKSEVKPMAGTTSHPFGTHPLPRGAEPVGELENALSLDAYEPADTTPLVLSENYTVRAAGNGGFTVWTEGRRDEWQSTLAAFTTWGELIEWLARQHAKRAARAAAKDATS